MKKIKIEDKKINNTKIFVIGHQKFSREKEREKILNVNPDRFEREYFAYRYGTMHDARWQLVSIIFTSPLSPFSLLYVAHQLDTNEGSSRARVEQRTARCIMHTRTTKPRCAYEGI